MDPQMEQREEYRLPEEGFVAMDSDSQNTPGPTNPPRELRSGLSVRAVLVGVFCGTLLCFSNMFFGLRTGWVTMGSLQSALLGFGIFKMKCLTRRSPLSVAENVVIQTTAVAVATMPLAGGFVGIFPAFKLMEGHPQYSLGQLLLWSIGVSMFGVFFAVPLRVQTIIKEKLPFPSGTATAELIGLLHHKHIHPESELPSEVEDSRDAKVTPVEGNKAKGSSASSEDSHHDSDRESNETNKGQGDSPTESESLLPPDDVAQPMWQVEWKKFWLMFLIAASFPILTLFVPITRALPIATWLQLSVVSKWGWTLSPSCSLVGQGIIMGAHTALSMLVGAVLGWALLGPIAAHVGWAPGPVMDSITGPRGWILWIALAMMMGEGLTSLGIISFNTWSKSKCYAKMCSRKPVPATAHQYLLREDQSTSQVSPKIWGPGLIASTALCVCITSLVFNSPFYEPLLGVCFAMLVSLIAVRALGATDLNPVSGVGKLSQIVFAGIAPGKLTSNLLAGAIAEAGEEEGVQLLRPCGLRRSVGAQQAGDMLQDLKTGHLLRASPKDQFYAQVLGSFLSCFVTIGAYALFTSAYKLFGPELPVPVAQIWLDMAKVVNGGHIAQHVLPWCIGGALYGVLQSVLHHWKPRITKWFPNPVALAVGMTITPNNTIPRVIGGLLDLLWRKKFPRFHEKSALLIASAFVLGEGVAQIVAASATALGVPPLTCAGCAPGACTGCS